MPASTSISNLCYLCATCIALFLFSPCAYSKIYKWVDTNGQVHYSDKKVNAGELNAEELELDASLNLMQSFDASEINSRKRKDKFVDKPAKTRKKSTAVNRADESVSDYRCRLAQNILSGKAKLSSGAPAGQYEFDVAKRDMNKYCN